MIHSVNVNTRAKGNPMKAARDWCFERPTRERVPKVIERPGVFRYNDNNDDNNNNNNSDSDNNNDNNNFI